MSTYWDQVDRNLGILTRTQQESLKKSTIAVAGCGGMGGLLAATLVRVGVGHIKIADNQVFELSNVNRQFAATISTIGKNKALSTYAAIRDISEECEIEVFSEGVTADNATEFVRGCDVICDEIEFFEVGARVILHQAARYSKVPIINCNVVGFGTRIFLFVPDGMTVEEFLEVDEKIVVDGTVVSRLLHRLAPRLPPYARSDIINKWIFEEHRAPIFGGTPPISTGIVVNRLCAYLFGKEIPGFVELPPMPAYGYFDSLLMEAGVHVGKWW